MSTPPDFPPNNEASKDPKKITPIATTATRRKKSLRKQFSSTFVAGDARSAIQYVIFDVLLPAAKDTIVEAASQGIEKLIFGTSRRRGATAPQHGAMGNVQYNRMSRYSSGPQRTISRQARAQHDFDEIFLDNRTEAEEVIDKLFEIVSRYDQATVADLYELVGLSAVHTDHRWGWTDLYGAGVRRIRGGYLLDLPEPQPLQ